MRMKLHIYDLQSLEQRQLPLSESLQAHAVQGHALVAAPSVLCSYDARSRCLLRVHLREGRVEAWLVGQALACAGCLELPVMVLFGGFLAQNSCGLGHGRRRELLFVAMEQSETARICLDLPLGCRVMMSGTWHRI